MSNKFYEIKKNRKYASFVDEYRRYYVTGKNFKIKAAKNKQMGAKLFQFCVEEVTKPIWKNEISTKINYDNYVKGIKLGSSKHRKNITIVEFKKDHKFTLQYEDNQHNTYRIIIAIKSNDSHKIQYSEWIKKAKPFFGLNDTLGKIFLRRSIIAKTKLLQQKINLTMFNIQPKKTVASKRKPLKQDFTKRGGFIQRRLINYNNDLAAKLNQEMEPPDRPTSFNEEQESN